MNILFFQNCISPHQMPYIKELCKLSGVENVYVISPVDDLEERKNMGWGNDNNHFKERYDGVSVVIAPAVEEVEALYKKYEGKDTWCMFSGINAFPEVSKWFRLSLNFNVRRGIITEPPYIYEHPFWQHAIRFALKDWRYTNYIDKFFVMGDEYVWYYKMWSKKWDVIPFMYCTEWRERNLPVPDAEKLKVLYVGSLCHRKNVSELLCALKSLPRDRQQEFYVGIVGNGDKREELENLVSQEEYNIDTKFYGGQRMEDIPAIMQEYDVLVLPSRHDGWGAVVNEALTLGLYVICSNKCGAKYLLKEVQQGCVYKSGDSSDLQHVLLKCLCDKEKIRTSVSQRIEWARRNISGKAVANYLLNHLILTSNRS